ncbi:MAG: hypothetical protein V4663_14620 [Bacteroidota bacterium]
MKLSKRKAKRISDRPIKKKISKQTNHIKSDKNNTQGVYAGSEKVMLDLVVGIIVKIIKKEVGL